MNCKICNKESEFVFKKKVLNKYDAEYFQCRNCGFIQVENPHWLHEAYENAISASDTGLVSRNLNMSSFTEKLIVKYFNCNEKFIDYGGGYGLFVRLMRDAGFNFYRQDNYCQNLFAIGFDLTDLKDDDRKFELLTTFEVFEHLENPLAEIENMLKLSDSILFSTVLQPKNIKEEQNWWYFSPESGQHISFYTEKSLAYISQKFNLNFYTDSRTLHLLTKKQFKKSPFETDKLNILSRIINKICHIMPKNDRTSLKSLTQKDNELIIKNLNQIKINKK